MSPLRIVLLVASAVSSTVALARIAEGRPGSDDLIIWLMGVTAVIGWSAFVAFSVYERTDDRLTELAGQIAAVGEMVGEYGDHREATGYMSGVRDTGGGALTRVK